MNFNLLLLNNELADMPAPFGFENWLTFWMVIAVSVTNAILMTFAGYKFLQVVQLSSYKMRGYFGWIKDTKGAEWGRLVVLSFLSSAALLITNVLLEDFFQYKIMTYLGLVFYLIFCIVYIVNQYTRPQKTPLKYTQRMTRMVVVYALLVFVLSMVFLNVSFLYIPYFKYGAIGLTPMFIPLLVCLAYYIMLPFETLHNKSFIKKAKKKLNSYENLIKIGITGSYAKTSVKNILASMLSEKYSVCCSPLSYNTPLGLSKTILENLKKDDQIFIAEMGARYVGDISTLCEIVKPNIGIITGIGNQHLLTFGSKENLIKTKSELTHFVESCGGKMFFNGDNEQCRLMAESCISEKVVSLPFEKNPVIYAEDITYDKQGVNFTLVCGNKKLKTTASLLGAHNVSNIILCANVCLSLGLTLEEIEASIRKLVASPHRLALIPSSGSLIVIDDAYNGSVEGSKAALNVLASYAGVTKVVITPGLVELGIEQYESNKELGRLIAKNADYVIINGTTNYESLNDGLIAGGMANEKILRSGSLKQAVTLLQDITKPGDVVLFENDLPDNYN